jgi:rhamnogalacturonyl hydrolase YesR
MKTTTNRIRFPLLSQCALLVIAAVLFAALPAHAQDVATSQPARSATLSGGRTEDTTQVLYRMPKVEEITEVLERVRAYLETASPAYAINRQTGAVITDLSKPNLDAVPNPGESNAFLLVCYESGVTYAGMLLAADVTGNAKFADYTARHLELIKDLLPSARLQLQEQPSALGDKRPVLYKVIDPQSLDDSGALCAAMIKARRAGVGPDILPVIKNYIDYISTKQFRLPDGTLARRRPQPESLWVDDLYMSVPALAQMGKLTGDRRYYDDAARQILQFSARTFISHKGLYMHGWTANSEDHPEFFWARANGWAIMAMVELLEMMPEEHPQRAAVLNLLRAHLRGLAACQSSDGLWHNLLDRNDSYLETSASAMYVYSMARAINRGWVSSVVYGPVAQVGWNAVAAKVNAKGQVEDTCIGTGLAFDPVYYYRRPRSVYAAHGYGATLLAGAEMIKLMKSDSFGTRWGMIHYQPKPSNP